MLEHVSCYDTLGWIARSRLPNGTTDPSEDINQNGELIIPLDDDTKHGVGIYRDKLYDELKKLRKDAPGRLNKFFRFNGSNGGSAR